MKRLLLGLTLTLLGSSRASAAEVSRQVFTAQFEAYASSLAGRGLAAATVRGKTGMLRHRRLHIRRVMRRVA